MVVRIWCILWCLLQILFAASDDAIEITQTTYLCPGRGMTRITTKTNTISPTSAPTSTISPAIGNASAQTSSITPTSVDANSTAFVTTSIMSVYDTSTIYTVTVSNSSTTITLMSTSTLIKFMTITLESTTTVETEIKTRSATYRQLNRDYVVALAQLNKELSTVSLISMSPTTTLSVTTSTVLLLSLYPTPTTVTTSQPVTTVITVANTETTTVNVGTAAYIASASQYTQTVMVPTIDAFMPTTSTLGQFIAGTFDTPTADIQSTITPTIEQSLLFVTTSTLGQFIAGTSDTPTADIQPTITPTIEQSLLFVTTSTTPILTLATSYPSSNNTTIMFKTKTACSGINSATPTVSEGYTSVVPMVLVQKAENYFKKYGPCLACDPDPNCKYPCPHSHILSNGEVVPCKVCCKNS